MDEIWWKRISGPIQFLEKVSDAIYGKGSVWLNGTLPWANTFHNIVKGNIQEKNCNINVALVDGSEKQIPKDSIFELDSMAKENYLPSMDLSEYVKKGNILENTIIWVHGLDGEEASQWLELSRKLANCGAGLKIICEGKRCAGTYRNIKVFLIQELLTKFDILLFAMYGIPASLGNPEERIYSSYLASSLAKADVEKMAVLLGDMQNVLKDPIVYMAERFGDAEFATTECVRNAQINAIYPILERETYQLVERLKDELRHVIPFEDDFGGEYKNYKEVELRHMVYFEARKKIRLTQEESEWLQFLHRLRNDISHRKIIVSDDVQTILRHAPCTKR